MLKRILTLAFCSASILFANAQDKGGKKDKKGIFYVALGSNRIWYTPSDIRVRRSASPGFDFTLSKVKAKDEGGLIFDTAPQFSYTIGYYFTKTKLGLEYELDHVKYFATKNQKVRMRGTIDGIHYDKDTTLTPGFFMLEHSDGANYGTLSLVKWVSLTKKQSFFYPEWLIKAGFGLVNPKTNSTILGNYRDDKYHISGHIISAETGLRFHFGKTFFATASFKGTYANYYHFLINGGTGSQKWYSGQFNYLIGGQFPL